MAYARTARTNKQIQQKKLYKKLQKAPKFVIQSRFESVCINLTK